MWGQSRQLAKWELAILYVILFIALCQQVAHAAEAPTCAYSEGRKTVICDTEGFGRIMQRCSEGQAGRAECEVRLDAALKAWKEAKDGLTACVGQNKPRSAVRPVTGYLLGLAGVGALVFAPMIDGDASRWGVSLVGVGAVLTGLWAVMP